LAWAGAEKKFEQALELNPNLATAHLWYGCYLSARQKHDAGLVFLDLKRSQTLQLIGRPEILWELDDPQQESGGTRRYWDFHIERWRQLDIPRTLGMGFS